MSSIAVYGSLVACRTKQRSAGQTSWRCGVSTQVGSSMHDAMAAIHQQGLEVAERVDPIVCGQLTELAHAKKLTLAQPVSGLFHHDQPDRGHRIAVWQLSRDRGAFLAKVELLSDDTFKNLYLKASLQSRFWEAEALHFGEGLCKAAGMHVELERTQSDGIISCSASWDP